MTANLGDGSMEPGTIMHILKPNADWQPVAVLVRDEPPGVHLSEKPQETPEKFQNYMGSNKGT